MSPKQPGKTISESLPTQPERAESGHGANSDGIEERLEELSKEVNERFNALSNALFQTMDQVKSMIDGKSKSPEPAKANPDEQEKPVAITNDSKEGNNDTSTDVDKEGNNDTSKGNHELVLAVPDHGSSGIPSFRTTANQTGMGLTNEYGSYAYKATNQAPKYEDSATVWANWVRNKAEIIDEIYDRFELKIHVWTNVRSVIPAKYLIGYQDRQDVVDDYHHIVKHLNQFEHQQWINRIDKTRLQANTTPTWTQINELTDMMNEIIDHHNAKQRGITRDRLEELVIDAHWNPSAAIFAGEVRKYAKKLDYDDSKALKDITKEILRKQLVAYYHEANKSRSRQRSSTAETRYNTQYSKKPDNANKSNEKKPFNNNFKGQTSKVRKTEITYEDIEKSASEEEQEDIEPEPDPEQRLLSPQSH